MSPIISSVISIAFFTITLYFIASKLKLDLWLDKSNARRITAIFLSTFIFIAIFGGIDEAHITGIYNAIGKGFSLAQFSLVISFVSSKKSRMKVDK